jgi:isoquinoline 1-oxidoreductase alpha subunit
MREHEQIQMKNIDFKVNVNGKDYALKVFKDIPLIWILRNHINLTGTKYGCGIGACGACTIHDNGIAVRSCQITAAEANGKSYITIEGLSENGNHPCQKAWLKEDVAQCGFCQPGMIMTAVALLKDIQSPTDEDINERMMENVCRCGTYNRIRDAIKRAAKEMKNEN